MTLQNPSFSLAPGTELGHYVIEAKVGEGGMGIVYRAVDARLDRPVAVKFLSEDLADVSARRRFQHEAQMASALNHPHIVSVYDVGELQGRQYLVTELIEGGSLTAWARGERRSWRQIVEMLVGVADGLAAAHGAGILHRDVKPDNVLVTTSGYAKLVDFGLARLDERSEKPASSVMLTSGWTGAGIVVGTLAYMSPEQAAGKPIDARSDIFSFGVMLYELLAGVRPFDGATHLELLQAVSYGLLPKLPAKIPPPLVFVVEKALEKDPDDRYQSMREIVVDLRRLTRRTTAEFLSPATPGDGAPRSWRSVGRWGTAAAVFAALGGITAWVVNDRLTPSPAARSIQVQRLTDFVGLEEAPALSPDGRTVAFVAVGRGGKRQIHVRLLAGGAPLTLTTAEVDHYEPRWSPDSSSLIYFTRGVGPVEASTLWEISALGGTPRRLVEALGPGDLSHDGALLAFFRFHDGGIELAVSRRDLADVRVVAELPPGRYSNLRWSPDDRSLAFIHELGGASFATQIVVVAAAGGEPRWLGGDYYLQGAAWLPDGSGWVVSSAQGSLMSYPPTYNLWRMPVTGGPATQLTFGESSYEFPDIGAQGRLVASRVRAQSDVVRIPVTGDPVTNAGEALRVTRQTGLLQTVTVSADETTVAVLSDNGGHANVWSVRIADGDMRPVTRELDPRIVVAVPVWSPRGDWINYLSTRSTGTADVTLWLARPDGTEPRDLAISGAWACWSGDGEWLYYSSLENGIHHIRKVRIDGAGGVQTVRTDNAIGCDVARDGSALYYATVLTQSTATWDLEIRVARPEDAPSEIIGRVSGTRVPTGAINFHALLSPDGAWLAMPLIDGATTNIWAVSTTTGEWRQLTDFGERNVMIARRIAWSKDGRHVYASLSDVDSDVVMLAGLP